MFPGGSEVKASACNARDLGSIPGLGRSPWRRKWQPLPVFLPGESHGRRSVVGYSPWKTEKLKQKPEGFLSVPLRKVREGKTTEK